MEFYVGAVFGAVIMACIMTKSVRDGFKSLIDGIIEKFKK